MRIRPRPGRHAPRSLDGPLIGDRLWRTDGTLPSGDRFTAWTILRDDEDWMTQLQHKHVAQPKRTQVVAFRSCVIADACVPEAHGDLTAVEVCRCGARRQINRNGGSVEYGRWDGGR